MRINIFLLTLLLFVGCQTIPDGYSKIDKKGRIVYKNDHVEEVEFWQHLDLIQADFGQRTYLNLYIGRNKSGKYYRLKFNYSGSDWIFFEKAILSGNNERTEFKFKSYEKTTNVGQGGAVDDSDFVPFSFSYT